MKYLIGCDIGTSGTKTVLFDEDGKIISSAYADYPLYQPQTGYAEQDPDDWANAFFSTVNKAVKDSGVSADDICGIGLSGQMHGLVMLDENGKVFRKSIIWCDQRTNEECEEITAAIGREKLIEITGNPAITGFTASKILWIKKHEPQIWDKCRHILLPKDYVRYCITGQFISDMSDASGTQLLNVEKRDYAPEMLSLLEIKREYLPDLVESAQTGGRLTAEAAERCGLRAGTVVAGSAGDQAAAAVGNGIVASGKVSCNLGTSGVVFACTDGVKKDPKGRIHTFCHAVPGKWHVMGVTQAAGLSVKWFKDNFYSEEAKNCKNVYKIIDSSIAECEAGAKGLIYLPYLMGERTPHLDADARGVFFGVTASHNKVHFARAVMEGVCYSLLDCMRIIEQTGEKPLEVRLCGGGANSEVWKKILTDIFGCECSVTNSSEAGALGAAILAGTAAGVFDSVESACSKMIKTTAKYAPSQSEHAKYMKNYAVYDELYTLLKDEFAKVKGI